MVDKGGRDGGSDEHPEPEDREIEGRESTPHGNERPEPDRPVGSSEWLLQQLSGGRLKSIFDSPRPPAPVQRPTEDGAGSAVNGSEAAAADAPSASATSGSERPVEAESAPRHGPAAPVGLWPGEPVLSAAPAPVEDGESGDTSADDSTPDRADAPPAADAPLAADAPPAADGRPTGATAPAPREPAPPAVYEWPDPRGNWDQPPVWEQIVAPRDEPDRDGGDEELWRETAGAYAWDLEPASEPAVAAEAAPFRTAPAAAHVNAAAPRTSRSARSRPGSRERESAPVGPPLWRTLSRRRLLIALIAAGAVILLAVLFAIGIAVGSAGDQPDPQAAPAVSETPTNATPAPTGALPTVGPLPAGTWAWRAMLGGECVQPFDSVWAEEFTVVDCATAHSAQLVAKAELTDAAFPGQEALAVTVSSLCQAQGVVSISAAEAYGDVQVSGAFPVTQEQWDAGERSYYCFVNRAGGGELTGSLAGSPAG